MRWLEFYKELTTVMYNVRTHVFSTTINATDMKNCTVKITRYSYTFYYIFVKKSHENFYFLSGIIKDSRKSKQISHIAYIFTFRYAFNLTDIYARFLPK